jgi:predicted anti-sigma-YlaC factor YlaD
MERVAVVPLIIGGVLIVIFRNRLAAAFDASNRAFYGSLLGEERAKRIEGKPDSRRYRFNQAWAPWFLLFLGLAWIALGLLVLVGPLLGLGE